MQEADSQVSLERSPTPRWRWLTHLLMLASYPLVLGLVGAMSHSTNSAPMLPSRVVPLLAALSVDFLLFIVVFGLALLFSRPTATELFLKWNEGVKPLLRGFLYSIALRVMLAVVTIVIVAAAGAMMTGGDREKISSVLRPEVENLVDPAVLSENPFYLLVNVSVVSFLFAGFREELWRAGMLAGFNALLPNSLETATGRCVAVGLSSIVFGLGHLPQGLGGVLMTTTLGIGLGFIMLRNRSIWEAVFAHGFFNATSFLLLFGLARFRPDLLSH